MEPTDLTIELLKSIRDELKGTNKRLESLERTTNERLDQTNERLDQTNERLDQTNERLEALERRQGETELRLATELVSIVGALGEVKTLLRENYATTIRDHERRITTLENRTAD